MYGLYEIDFAISIATKYPSKSYKFEGYFIGVKTFAIMFVFATTQLNSKTYNGMRK